MQQTHSLRTSTGWAKKFRILWETISFRKLTKGETGREFPGSSVVRILHFHYRGYEFNPWSGNYDPVSCMVLPKQQSKNGEILDQMVHKRRYMAGPALLAPTADLGWVSSYLLSEAGWRGGRSLKKKKRIYEWPVSSLKIAQSY